MTTKPLLFLGDSLIEYFDWTGRFPGRGAVNLGKAGETAEGLLARLGGIARLHPVAGRVFVMTGTNNVATGDLAIEGTWRTILQALRKNWPEAALHPHSLLPLPPDWVDPGAVAALNGRLAAIAKGEGASFVDLYRLFTDTEGRQRVRLFDADGVHLSPGGYALWSEVIGRLIGP